MAFGVGGVFRVTVTGLSESIRGLDDLVRDFPNKAAQAVNKTARFARTRSSERIRAQVAFAARDLIGPAGKLTISFANPGNIEAVVTGHQRPRSLAGFAKNQSFKNIRKQGGVSLTVKPGQAKFMSKAFLVRLPQGDTLTDTIFNLGLAIRLKPGESVRNKKKMARLSGNVYLLYGPSVDQVFRTVAEDVSPETLDFLEAEALRLVELKNA